MEEAVPTAGAPGPEQEEGQRTGPAAIDEGSVMVVDDDPTTVTLLSAHARRFGYSVHAFLDPVDAMEAMSRVRPDVLVTDMVMPGMTGADLAREARRLVPEIEVILITGVGDDRTARAVQELDAADYLLKPIDPDRFARVLREALVRQGSRQYQRHMLNWMYRSMAEAEARTAELTLGALEALMQAMDARSQHFTGHSRAVALLAAAVAQELGLSESEIEAVRRAGLLHDIGMIGVPDAIVQKPGALTEEEVEVVRKHPEVGARILTPIKHFSAEARYVLDHHERWDGSGYPAGKLGDEISLGGQIVGVAEAWTGITEHRAHRTAISAAEGYELLMQHRDEWFSAGVIEALVASDIGVVG